MRFLWGFLIREMHRQIASFADLKRGKQFNWKRSPIISSSSIMAKTSEAGLNLCFRSLAAILKYDRVIPLIRAKDDSFCKGYYSSEEQLVEKIKRGVLGAVYPDFAAMSLRVVEMQIMDIADDIAYSTYDFEDALKAGFGSPLDLLQQMNNNLELRDAVGWPDSSSRRRAETSRRTEKHLTRMLVRWMQFNIAW